MTEIIAEAVNQMGNMSGSIQGALGCLGAALGVGFVGAKAVDAVGRNPGAFGKMEWRLRKRSHFIRCFLANKAGKRWAL